MAAEEMAYIQTDEEVAEVAEHALAYIFSGDDIDAPYNLRGLCVYGVIGMLRENDERFHGEDSVLDAAERERVAEVEAEVTKAVNNKLQFYPFGHYQKITSMTGDRDDRQRSMDSRTGSIPAANNQRSPLGHKK